MSARIPVGDTFAIIDDDDFERVSAFRWYKSSNHRKTIYAQTGCRGKFQTMHRLVMAAPRGMQVDHINGNGLDNRKSNLRLCSLRQNQLNSRPKSGQFKGVSPTRHGTFRAVIHSDGKQQSLGSYKTEVEAARAYNKAAAELFGEFARLNEVGQ